MDGGDDTLRAIDATASLNDQVQVVESGLEVIVPGHGVARFRCHLTGDGKGMASRTHAPCEKCWCCDDGSWFIATGKCRGSYTTVGSLCMVCVPTALSW